MSVVTISEEIDETPSWRRHEAGDVRLWISGRLRTPPDAVCESIRRLAAGRAEAAEVLRGLDGQFALIAACGEITLAAADRVRSVPVCYAAEGAGWRIDPIGGRLARRIGLTAFEPSGEVAFAMAGYTVGRDTLFCGLESLLAGEAVLWRGGAPTRIAYYRYLPKPELGPRTDPAALRRRLSDITLSLLQDLIERAGKADIVVPLSAGLDSRIIVSGLHALGRKRVRTFSYGLPGNHEAKAARRIAAHLGYPWRFVPMTPGRMRRFFEGELHARYLAYADTAVACPFEQDLAPVSNLLQDGYIAPDALMVNGNSGDFITGGHVPAALHGRAAGPGRDEDIAVVADALLAKHFRLWTGLAGGTNDATIRNRLIAELEAAAAYGPESPPPPFALYEAAEFQDRQTKYVINGQRAYEFLGLDWALPLWDRAYLDFWATVPIDLKAGQKLYREMLAGENWGGVWTDAFTVRQTVRPRWLIPLRFAVKAAHAPMGRARWRETERRFFGWWMDTMAASAVVPYRTAFFETRGARNSVSWHSRRYLEARGSRLYEGS